MNVLHFVPTRLDEHVASLSDCIEAGLPYDWSRLDIDPAKEENIVGALLAATGNHPPAATGRDPTTASATRVKNKDEEPDASSGGSGSDAEKPAAPSACAAKPQPVPLAASGSPAGGLRAAVLYPATLAATGTPGSCGSACAAAAVGTAEGQCWEEKGDNGSRSANVATTRGVTSTAADMESEGGCVSERGAHGDSSNGGSSSSGGSSNEAGAARVAPRAGAEDGAEGAKGAGEMGRWDSVRLKEVKELAPAAEYWEIRMVLARLKAGWCGCSS